MTEGYRRTIAAIVGSEKIWIGVCSRDDVRVRGSFDLVWSLVRWRLLGTCSMVNVY